MTDSQAAHVVQFFGADDSLIDAACRFVRDGIDAGCTCVVLATPAHREHLDARLQAIGLNPAELAAQYRYIAVDARATLATFLDNGKPDPQRFHHSMGLLVRQAAARGQPVRIFGELVALLAEEGLTAEGDGHMKTAIRLEELWNELSRHHTFTLFCAYPLAASRADPKHDRLIRAVHSHVLPAQA